MSKYPSAGFTLLEMIVVLVLIGVLTALVMPGIQKMYSASEASISRNDVRNAINQLPLIAKFSATPIVITAYPNGTSTIPAQLEEVLSSRKLALTAEPSLNISALGFCADASEITISLDGLSYQLKTRVPDCQVVE